MTVIDADTPPTTSRPRARDEITRRTRSFTELAAAVREQGLNARTRWFYYSVFGVLLLALGGAFTGLVRLREQDQPCHLVRCGSASEGFDGHRRAQSLIFATFRIIDRIMKPQRHLDEIGLLHETLRFIKNEQTLLQMLPRMISPLRLAIGPHQPFMPSSRIIHDARTLRQRQPVIEGGSHGIGESFAACVSTVAVTARVTCVRNS